MAAPARSLRDATPATSDSSDEGEPSSAASIPIARLRELSAVHPVRALARSLTEWALILGAAWACERYFSGAAYILCVVWIGSRQLALHSLVHEATHQRFVPWRRWNDRLADPVAAWPLFMTTRAYRNAHFPHHRHLNSELDPFWVARQSQHDYALPKSWWGFLGVFVRYVTGLGALTRLWTLVRLHKSTSSRHEQRLDARALCQLACYVVAATSITWLGAWKLVMLYWIVPLATWKAWTTYLKGFVEHSALPATHPLNKARTTLPGLFSRLLLLPLNIHYHIEHHLYPSVPYYRLPVLHRELMASAEYRRLAHVTRGFWRVLREGVAFRPS